MDDLFLDLVQKYLDHDLSYFFQKHILNGEDIDLVKEKWIDGFSFRITEGIRQLVIDKNKNIRYPAE